MLLRCVAPIACRLPLTSEPETYPLRMYARFFMSCSKSTPPTVALERRIPEKAVSDTARVVFSSSEPTNVAPPRKSRLSRPAK